MLIKHNKAGYRAFYSEVFSFSGKRESFVFINVWGGYVIMNAKKVASNRNSRPVNDRTRAQSPD